MQNRALSLQGHKHKAFIIEMEIGSVTCSPKFNCEVEKRKKNQVKKYNISALIKLICVLK